MRIARWGLAACLACVSSGCSEISNLWKDRYGPPAIYDAADVNEITQRQVDVLHALAAGAQMMWPPPQSPSAYWYELTLVGFNVVDDQCTQYMEDLFGWERKRNRTKDILTLGAATAATVLGMTSASQKSLVLTAQAFGFASGAWTIVADSYLYKLSPATIASIEEKLQAAYRSTAEQNKSSINNGASAFLYLRGYLNLCLPVTIENKVADYLAQTTGKTQPTDGGTPGGPGPKFRAAAAPPIPTGAVLPQVGLTSTQR